MQTGIKLSEQNKSKSGTMTTVSESRKLRFRLRSHILQQALSVYRDPFVTAKVVRALIRQKKVLQGSLANTKWVQSGGRYFWNVSSAGWPSEAFDGFILHEMNRIEPTGRKPRKLQTMIFSITSRCPLRCDHCYEWNNLSTDETLSLAELKTILKKFQDFGISNIQFSGGEPLSRFADLIELIRSAQPGTDLWILTSGFGLTQEKAQELKQAGLTGVVISLDHWDAQSHNSFRRNDSSYNWVMQAADNSLHADLVTAFSLCARREFVTEENLLRYLQLAKDKGANIVRILEPRKAGHFVDQDIELKEPQTRILDDFFLKVNSDPAFADLPIMDYTGYYQRRSGCYGAGDRYLYVDSKGDIHACPFCQNPGGNALTDPLDESIAKLRKRACHKFSTLQEAGI